MGHPAFVGEQNPKKVTASQDDDSVVGNEKHWVVCKKHEKIENVTSSPTAGRGRQDDDSVGELTARGPLGAGSLFLEGESDVAGVAAGVLDQDFSVASLDHVGKFFAPFHQ
jgi:hypothetical protein